MKTPRFKDSLEILCSSIVSVNFDSAWYKKNTIGRNNPIYIQELKTIFRAMLNNKDDLVRNRGCIVSSWD